MSTTVQQVKLESDAPQKLAEIAAAEAVDGVGAPCRLLRLARQDVIFHYLPHQTVHVGAHIVCGALFWTKVALADFPNDYPTLDDLEDALLESVDVLASVQHEDHVHREVDKSTRARAGELCPLFLDYSV